MQGRDYIPCDIAEYHLLDVAELPPKDKNRALCDMRSFLREGRYGELDKQLESALTASFLSRDAEQRYYRGWMDMENTPDLRSVISMGPEGLAQIKAWQHDCPESNHAGWLKRCTGIIVPGGIAAMAGRRRPLLRCGYVQPPVMK